MDTLTTPGVQMRWDSAARLVVVQFTVEHITAGESRQVNDAVAEWTRQADWFAALVDLGVVRSVDAEYRRSSWEFLRGQRPRPLIAAYNAAPWLRILIDMFRVGTGVQLRGFAEEPPARAWLRAQGVAA